MNERHFIFSKPIATDDSTVVIAVRDARLDTVPGYLLRYDTNCNLLWKAELPPGTNFINLTHDLIERKVKVYYYKWRDEKFVIYSCTIPIPA
jgi:hypothetical protein